MPFVPLPKQADLRSVIGFYLEYMTLCRKSQSLGKDKCRYSDEVVRGLSTSAATGTAQSRGRQHCLSVRNWAGSSSPTWLHSQRLFQCLASACSGFKKLQHKFISLLLIAIRTIRKGFPSCREITDRNQSPDLVPFASRAVPQRVSAALQMISWRRSDVDGDIKYHLQLWQIHRGCKAGDTGHTGEVSLPAQSTLG